MKKSISIWSFYTQESLEEKLWRAKEAGFEGFEIDLSADGPVNPATSRDELLAIRRLFEKVGLEMSGLATGLYWGSNAASEAEDTRRQAREILERQIETAHTLGIDAILVVPGSVGVDFIPDCEIVPYETAYRRATDFIRQSLPHAERCRVRIGAYFDVGNTLANGYPEHWIEILGRRILRVHFKDYRRAVGSVDGFCDLLSGDVNWPAVMRALRSAGYQGWVTAEMIPPVPFYRYCPEVLIRNTGVALAAIMNLE
jgi:L-ribulose-5-phosphate 3-epimerase